MMLLTSRRAIPLLLLAGLCACSPKAGGAAAGIGGNGLPSSQLDTQIAAAIGDPATCVLLADRATGKVLYAYGTDFNCSRGLPACDAQTTLNAKAALKFAAKPDGRFASCASLPDGSRMVGWAEGAVQSAKRTLVYSAVMEGQRALPGHEINARLYDAFSKAGL